MSSRTGGRFSFRTASCVLAIGAKRLRCSSPGGFIAWRSTFGRRPTGSRAGIDCAWISRRQTFPGSIGTPISAAGRERRHLRGSGFITTPSVLRTCVCTALASVVMSLIAVENWDADAARLGERFKQQLESVARTRLVGEGYARAYDTH